MAVVLAGVLTPKKMELMGHLVAVAALKTPQDLQQEEPVKAERLVMMEALVIFVTVFQVTFMQAAVAAQAL